MKFLWPDMLWLLTVLPVLVAAYLLVLRRAKRAAVRYASLSIIKDAMGRSSIRRHVPAVLLLSALGATLVSMARPAAVIVLPSNHETVILAIDVSGSMRAEDVQPSRLAAAQAAASSFIAEQPPSTRIGIVEFSGSAVLAQPPTQSREELQRTIHALQPQNATAIGSAILVSLKALFPDAKFELESWPPHRNAASAAGGMPLNQGARSQNPAPKPVQPGSYKSAAIILLTDGQNTAGPHPVEAARMAAERGVRVYTVGFGTGGGEISWGGASAMRVALDEATLRTVAELTGADYFHAGNASELTNVYRTLTSELVLEKKSTEITALFAAAAALAMVLASLFSLLWFSRIS
jgi:Ca-activated chloride channel family protein